LTGDLTYLLGGGDGGYLGSPSGLGWLGLGGVAVVGLKEEWRMDGCKWNDREVVQNREGMMLMDSLPCVYTMWEQESNVYRVMSP